MRSIVFGSLLAIVVSGCGYKSINNELTGQVKKIIRKTPLLCPDYTYANISLGIMRGGIGSVSNEDIVVVVSTPEQEQILKDASLYGELVRIVYNTKRISFCKPDERMVSVEILDDSTD